MVVGVVGGVTNDGDSGVLGGSTLGATCIGVSGTVVSGIISTCCGSGSTGWKFGSTTGW